MKFQNWLASSVILLLFHLNGVAQELNCSVLINADFVENSERGVFRKMEAAFSSFLNETKWTDDTYQSEERIKCNFIITISGNPSTGTYQATTQIVSARPVYGTDYESIVFNFADRDWEFEFADAQSIFFDQNSFTSNISSLLAYYAYIIIGYDYDTFSPKGGDPYFQKAWEIVNNAQRSGFSGWEQFNSIRNRYWLAENLISPQLQPLRDLNYTYYRNGLDKMLEEPEASKKNIAESIKQLGVANNVRPRTIAILSFMDAKEAELVSLFSEGNIGIRRGVYEVLTNIDPSRIDKFKSIIDK